MIRNLDGLQPDMRELALAHEAACQAHGMDVLIYCTLRPHDEQARLFRQGRALWEIKARADDLRDLYGRPDLADILMGVGPQKGRRILTWAAPGQSLHGYGYAYDGVPLIDGKIIYGNEQNIPDDIERAAWDLYGRLAVECGLEWAGNWPARKREMPHCQRRGVTWHDLIKRNPE